MVKPAQACFALNASNDDADPQRTERVISGVTQAWIAAASSIETGAKRRRADRKEAVMHAVPAHRPRRTSLSFDTVKDSSLLR